MVETIEYNGETYRRIRGKWVDKNNMVVTHLQRKLDNLYAAQTPVEEKDIPELVEEGDKYKDAGSYHLAIKCYQAALETGVFNTWRYVLSRLTSCYRGQGQPGKAIELYEEGVRRFGRAVQTYPLMTSIAAAYCDISEYDKAKKYADFAYAISNGKDNGELKGVYGRIRKETTGSGKYDGDYIRLAPGSTKDKQAYIANA